MGKLSEKQLNKCKHIFETMDTNKSGGIDIFEMYSAIRKFSKTVEIDEIVDIFNQYDLDSNGEIDFDEFITVIERFGFSQKNEEDALDVFLALGAKNDQDNLEIDIIIDYLSTFEIDYDDSILKKNSINGKINLTNFKKIFFNEN